MKTARRKNVSPDDRVFVFSSTGKGEGFGGGPTNMGTLFGGIIQVLAVIGYFDVMDRFLILDKLI